MNLFRKKPTIQQVESSQATLSQDHLRAVLLSAETRWGQPISMSKEMNAQMTVVGDATSFLSPERK